MVLFAYYVLQPSESKGNWKVLACLLVSVLILGWGAKYINSGNAYLDGVSADVSVSVPILGGGEKYTYADNAILYGTDAGNPSMAGFRNSDERKNTISTPCQWQKSTWLPESLEKYVSKVAEMRAWKQFE